MLQGRAICTIIAKNYIAFARTLAQSFLSFHPDYKCYVLIVDEFEGYVDPANECFEIVSLVTLEIPNLPSFCFKYNVTELCTAVKAHLLEYLICKKSVNKLLYIDPDILITNQLNDIYKRLDTYDIILTPHLDTDYPDDDLLPDDGYILRSGIFNLGFIGINASENVRSFLNWWKPKLYNRCVVDLVNGYFVDQKFIDFVPILFSNFFIEKNVGYNVAYWNLHGRRIGRKNDLWTCNDSPLYFFHFSGYDPEEPDTITKYISNDRARYSLSERTDLHQLFSIYKDKLINNGYQQLKTWPYSFACFDTGEPIPHELRVLYRNSAEREKYDNPFESKALKRQASILTMANKNHAFYVLKDLARYVPGLTSLYRRWISQ